LRYFDPTQSLILPAAAPNAPVHLVWPVALPLASGIQQQLSGWGLTAISSGSFVTIHYTHLLVPPARFPSETTFSDQITLLGYTFLELSDLEEPGAHRLLTYWRVERPITEPRRFFLHLVDDQGRPIVQQDTLGAPAEHWQMGDIIIQLHTLDVPASDGSGSLLLGIYNPDTNQRLITSEGQDAVRLNDS
jgi:hypothetical protein